MGSSSSKPKEEKEKEEKKEENKYEKTVNKSEETLKIIRVKEEEIEDNNQIKMKTLNADEKNKINNDINDLNNKGGKTLNADATGKLKLPPLKNNAQKRNLPKNITNLDSNDMENLDTNKNVDNEDNHNNNLKEEINNNNENDGVITINKISSNKEVNKNIKEEEKEEEKEPEQECEIDNNVDKELFKPIAELELNRKSVMKKSKYKGVTFVQNLKEYFPDDISKEEVRTMVLNALSEYIVQNPKNYIKGKNLTKEQSEALADIVYNRIVKNEDDDEENNEDKEKIEKYKILDDVKVKIGMSDLNDNIVKKLFFKNKDNVTDEEITRTINNLSQGNENVKVLIIEML